MRQNSRATFNRGSTKSNSHLPNYHFDNKIKRNCPSMPIEAFEFLFDQLNGRLSSAFRFVVFISVGSIWLVHVHRLHFNFFFSLLFQVIMLIIWQKFMTKNRDDTHSSTQRHIHVCVISHNTRNRQYRRWSYFFHYV